MQWFYEEFGDMDVHVHNVHMNVLCCEQISILFYKEFINTTPYVFSEIIKCNVTT